MAEDKSEELYKAYVNRLQQWENAEEKNFEEKISGTVMTYTKTLDTLKNASEKTINEKMHEKMTKFTEDMDKKAEDIFAAKAKEVWIKVNLSSLLTEKTESANFVGTRTGTIAHVEYHVIPDESEVKVESPAEESEVKVESPAEEIEAKVESPVEEVEVKVESPAEVIEVKVESPAEVLKVEGGIKKKLTLVLTQFINVVSIFVGVSAILYSATIPCPMMNHFQYLIIAGCIGMGVFGVLGFFDVWDVVGDIKDWDKRNESLERTEGPKLKSVWCYIGPVLLKMTILIGFSLFLTYLLWLLIYDKSCAERAEPPVGHWDH